MWWNLVERLEMMYSEMKTSLAQRPPKEYTLCFNNPLTAYRSHLETSWHMYLQKKQAVSAQ